MTEDKKDMLLAVYSSPQCIDPYLCNQSRSSLFTIILIVKFETHCGMALQYIPCAAHLIKFFEEAVGF